MKKDKRWDPNNNHFNNEGYHEHIEQFCRTGKNSPHEPSRQYFLKYVEDGDLFLDVGCGSCADYEILNAAGKKVEYMGVDYAQSIVEAARKLYPEIAIKAVDINNIPEDDNQWDVVNCRHVICHCEYYVEPIKELVRISRDRILITMWRPFTASDEDNIHYNDPYSWCNDYGRTQFRKFIGMLPVEIVEWTESLEGSPDTFIVLRKNNGTN